jgi:hypothetical protein
MKTDCYHYLKKQACALTGLGGRNIIRHRALPCAIALTPLGAKTRRVMDKIFRPPLGNALCPMQLPSKALKGRKPVVILFACAPSGLGERERGTLYDTGRCPVLML